MFRSARMAAFLVGAWLLGFGAAAADTSISAAGSATLQPLVTEAADAYHAEHPDVTIAVKGGGSLDGIAQVAAGSVDMGDSDVVAKGRQELVDHKVCVVGFALIANPDARVADLSKRQVQDIFSGKIVNWKQVGGADQRVVLINRPRYSGTRVVFVDTVMDGRPVAESGLQEEASGGAAGAVAATPGAISYVVLSGARDQAGIVALSIDGVAPGEAGISAGTYPFWSYEHIYTNGAPAKDVSRFIAFIQSNGELVHRHGYILVRDMQVSENDR